MRIAVLIIALFLTLIVGLQSCAITAGGGMTRNTELYGAGAGGILLALLFMLGAAFVMAMPRVSMWLFGAATLIGLGVGLSTTFKDLTIWGIVALALAVMSFFGHRELRNKATTSAPASGSVQP